MSEPRGEKAKAESVFSFIARHKLLLIWPVVVFVVATAILIYILARSPVAPFIYR